VAAIEAVQAGKAPPRTIRITYGEEHPLDRTIDVTIAGDGGLTATTSELRPGCLRPGFEECWTRSVKTVPLASEAHRKLLAAIRARELRTLPREDAVAPGAARVWITIDAGAAGRLDVRCSLETASGSADFERLRSEILGLVATAGPGHS